MSSNPNRKQNYKTGVSLEPEVVSYLDQLAAQTGLNRSWLLNTIVAEHARVARERGLVPPLSRGAVIRI
ncbi:MAG TPA: ribbon-helix-helix protein, CopG family [Tepidisphaeraceae bacterium]|jgi:predicted transcriptional regulator